MTDDRRAVVLGAGIAGLLAARALSDHYDHVTIIERDKLPSTAQNRRGAQQGRHAHALLARGQQILEEMFPGFTDEIAAAGARTGDMLEVSRLHFSGHRLHPATSGLTVISASRALLEHHVRTRVLARAGIDTIDDCDVAGLVTDRVDTTITGVRLLRRADSSAEETVTAELVIDATGRSSRTPAWLGDLGIDPPDEEHVVVDVAYATRRYRMNVNALGGDLAIICAPTPANPRMGGLSLLEDDVGMLTVAGICGDRPPLDPAGFDDFARSLAVADIGHAIADAEPLDDPVPHRFRASTWRRYDKSHLPVGFAVVGDSVCSFNPIYGQGMTIAALEADTLGQHLARHGRLIPRKFHRQVARIVRPAWQMATGADLQFPGVDGPRTRSQELVGSYIRRLHAAAANDPQLSRAFVRVSGLVDTPTALIRPSNLTHVLLRFGAPSEVRQGGRGTRPAP
jgi:2-polyprenyl-6-methoxyphenol hydroxylase-like FAD-dependent oxidoreductase